MDLVGTKEVCEILGVNPTNFWYVRERPGFPRPVTTLACGTIWRRVDIERYAVTRRAIGGRLAAVA